MAAMLRDSVARRRAYAPTSNTAAHDNHEKISLWVSFSLYGYGAPLGGPSGRRSSAITAICHLTGCGKNTEQIAWQYLVGKCFNYVENKRNSADQFQQLTN